MKIDHIEAYRRAEDYDSYIENIKEQLERDLTDDERDVAWDMYCELEFKYLNHS